MNRRTRSAQTISERANFINDFFASVHKNSKDNDVNYIITVGECRPDNVALEYEEVLNFLQSAIDSASICCDVIPPAFVAALLGGGVLHWWGFCWMLDTLRVVRWGEGVRWRGGGGGGVSWGGGGGGIGGFVDVKSWSKMQRRETLSLGPRPGKTAQKPLKSCWKTAQTAQILSGF